MIRRFLRLLLVVGLLAGLVWVTLALLDRSRFYEDRIEEELARFVSGELDIGSATASIRERTIDAQEITLRTGPDTEPVVVIPRLQVRLPLSLSEDGALLPDRITVIEPTLTLTEREDGSFSPLDLIRAVAPRFVPTVVLEGGTVNFDGRGPLAAVLREVLAPELEWRIDNDTIVTYPAPDPSPVLIGFYGRIGLQDVARVAVTGGYGRDESFSLGAVVDEIDLASASFRAALAPSLVAVLERFVPSGRAAMSLAIEVPPGAELDLTPSSLRGEVTASDLVIRHDAFSRPLEVGDLTLVYEDGNLRLPRTEIVDRGATYVLDGEVLDVLGRRAWRVTLRCDRLPSRDSLVSAITDPSLRRVIDDFDPHGPASVSVVAYGEGTESPHVAWQLDAGSAGPLSGSFVGHPSTRKPGEMVGFPYRLDDVRGAVTGVDTRVEIRSVTGTHNGGGRAIVDGWVDVSTYPETIEVRVRGKGVPIDDELIAGLEHTAAGAGATVRRFAPEAIVDLDVTVTRQQGDEESRISGNVSAVDAKLTLEDFPIPLVDVRASVDIVRDRYRIVEFEGRHGDARVTISGDVDARDSDAIAFDLDVNVTGLRADDEEVWAALRGVIDARGGTLPAFLDRMLPEGELDVELELKQEATGDTRFRALIWPRGIDLVPSWFPIPVEGITGRIAFGNYRPERPDDERFYVYLERLEGVAGDALVTCHGRLGEGLVESVRVAGEDVRLSAPLLDKVGAAVTAASASSGWVGERLGALLGQLDASGRISFSFDHRPASGDRLDVEFLGASFSADVLPPGGVSDLLGHLSVDLARERVDATRLRGRLLGGDAVVQSESLTVELGEERVRLVGDLDLGRLPFDEGLAPLVPPEFRGFFMDRAPAGSVRIGFDRFDVTLNVEGEGRPRLGALSFRGTTVFEDCRFEVPVLVEGFDGQLVLQGGGDFLRPGSFGIDGRFRDLALRTGGLSFDGLAATFTGDESKLELKDVSGSLAGGRLPTEGNYLAVETGPEGRISGAITVEDADLKVLLDQLSPSPRTVSGRLGATLAFDGPADRIVGLEGKGTVRMTDGQLWDLPVFAALYRFSLGLFVGEDDRPTFQTGEIDFRVQQGMLLLDRFELKAPVTLAPVGMTVHGKGVLGPTGVDLRVVPQVISWKLPLLSPAIDLLKGGLLNYRIYGPLANPRVAYWNAAADVMSPNLDVTRLPRLSPRREPVWDARF